VGRRPLPVAEYFRISRLDQNFRLQEDETLTFIENRGWTLVDTFVGHRMLRSRERRLELDRLLLQAWEGKFDIFLIWRSDRLFRSLRHMVNTLAELDVTGIKVVSVTESIDGMTPQGQLLIHTAPCSMPPAAPGSL